MSLMTPIKELKAPLRKIKPSITSLAFQPPTFIEKADLEDILSQMGRIGLATKAQRYCHLDSVHEAWCTYIAGILKGAPGSIPASPPPPEIRELIKDIAESIPSAHGLEKLLAMKDRGEEERMRKKAEKEAKALAQLLIRAFTGDRRALNNLRNTIKTLRSIGEKEAEALVTQLENEMKRRKIPGRYAQKLVSSIRSIAKGEASEDVLVHELEQMINERRKRPGKTTRIEPPHLQHQANKMASLAMQRLARLTPKKINRNGTNT